MPETKPTNVLTVICGAGLANRLRVLSSGLILARATNRQFHMVWPRTAACGAVFGHLFTNGWNIVESDENAVQHALVFNHLQAPGTPDLLAFPPGDLALYHVSWFFSPNEHPPHAPWMEQCAQLFSTLDPLPELQQRISTFAQQRFRPVMIGVHLRRGDFVRRRPNVVANTDAALAAVEHYLALAPDAGILLCSDDGGPDQVTGTVRQEGVHEIFARRFGCRVCWTQPRDLDRGKPETIQDALVDLWLLRRTQYFVGTSASSYSALAVFGRDVHAVFCGEPTPGYVRRERFARSVGLDQLLRQLPLSRRLGPSPTFHDLWEYYVTLPHRVLAKAGRRLGRRSP